jgi:hypothetical protein
MVYTRMHVRCHAPLVCSLMVHITPRPIRTLPAPQEATAETKRVAELLSQLPSEINVDELVTRSVFARQLAMGPAGERSTTAYDSIWQSSTVQLPPRSRVPDLQHLTSFNVPVHCARWPPSLLSLTAAATMWWHTQVHLSPCLPHSQVAPTSHSLP